MGSGGSGGEFQVPAVTASEYMSADYRNPNYNTIRMGNNNEFFIVDPKNNIVKSSKGKNLTFSSVADAANYLQSSGGEPQPFNLGGFFVDFKGDSIFIPDDVRVVRGGDGFVLQNNQGWRLVPTSFDNEEAVQNFLNRGFNDFQSKTYQTGKLGSTGIEQNRWANSPIWNANPNWGLPNTSVKASAGLTATTGTGLTAGGGTTGTTTTTGGGLPSGAVVDEGSIGPGGGITLGTGTTTTTTTTGGGSLTPRTPDEARQTDSRDVFGSGTGTSTGTGLTETTPPGLTATTTPGLTATPSAADIAAAAEADRLKRIAELEAKLKAAEDQYSALSKTYGETQGSYEDLTRRFEDLYGQFDTLTGSYADQKSAYDTLFGGYKTLEEQLADQRSALTARENEYRSLLDEYTGLQGSFGGLEEQYTGLESQFGGLRNQYDELMARLDEERTAYEKNLEEAARRRRIELANMVSMPSRPSYTAAPAMSGYTAVGGQPQTPTLSPGSYSAPPIDFLAGLPSYLQMAPDLRMPDFTGQYAINPLPGTSPVQAGPTVDVAAPFQPYLQAIYNQYGVNIPSGMTGIMGARR